jgi:hypothetical protein
VVAGVAGTITELSSSAESAIRWLTGTAPEQLVDVGPPLVAAVPFAVVAWLHAGRIRQEANGSGSARRVETGARLGLYPVALVGLAFGGVGIARLLGASIEGLFAPSPEFGDAWAHALADTGPIAVLGIATWLWAWRRVAGRVETDSVGEASSTIRRATLLIALAGSVLAGIGGAALVLYRLFGGLFGIQQSGDAISELSMPIATLLVAGVVAAYHGLTLRRDLAVRVETAPTEPPAVPLRPAAVVPLRLTVPPEGDAAAAVEALRAHLPPGYDLDEVPPSS